MKYSVLATAAVVGVLLLTACKKEEVTPLAAAEAGGSAKGLGAKRCYALVGTSVGSGLALVDQATRTMTYLADIMDDNGQPVDHFTGMAYDPLNDCTWLVTDNTTADPAQMIRLWRIDGPLPTVPGMALTAMPVNKLVDTNTGEEVLDAMDIEVSPAGKIILLRNDGGATSPNLAVLGTNGVVYDLPGAAPDVQALGFDNRGRLVTLQTINTQVPRLYVMDITTGSPIGFPTNFSTPNFLAGDAGLEGLLDPAAPTGICAANNNAPAGFATTHLPFPNVSNTFPTFDMTGM